MRQTNTARRHRVRLRALWFAIGLSGCATPAVHPVATPVLRRTDPLAAAMLAGHNRERASAGLPALAWSDRLAVDAAIHARFLADTGRFEHAVQPAGRTREGENLFAGTRGGYSLDEMLAAWTGERTDFVNMPTPGFSRSGNWATVGHYTQIMWRETRQVGCAIASGAGRDYLVCRYFPAGNVYGRSAY